MIFILIGVLTYISFFVILPGIGAVATRRRWERIRNIIYKYSGSPYLTYKNLEKGKVFSFEGKLESFKSDDVVWLEGTSISLCLNLKGRDVFTISTDKTNLQMTSWKSFSSMMEGTKFFVIGTLVYINGIPYLEAPYNDQLIVVIHDSESDIITEIVEKARDKNEIWNSYSPYSFITGVFALIILSYFSYKSSYNKATSFYLLVAAGTPFYFILPPGLYFYLKHRKYWDRSLRLSVLRDLYILKGRIEYSLKFKSISKKMERFSLLLYLLGYLLNTVIAGTILYKMYQLLISR